MASYGILDQIEEDSLHAARLLNVEEKLFKRLSKRLLAPDSLIYKSYKASQDHDPAVDTTAEVVSHTPGDLRRQWRDEALLDFASFENNILRTQFLLRSNEQERKRYGAEKDRILAAAQTARSNNGQLQVQLEEAQKTLALRKTYDDQAKKITDSPSLKSRDEQDLNIQKLQEEIAELERESEDYANTWVERREQFNKIFDAGEDLLRLIRDEKEEAERKEGMDDTDQVEGSSTPRGYLSGAGTPKALGDSAGLPAHEGDTSELGEPSVAKEDTNMDEGAEIEEGEEQEPEKMDMT